MEKWLFLRLYARSPSRLPPARVLLFLCLSSVPHLPTCPSARLFLCPPACPPVCRSTPARAPLFFCIPFRTPTFIYPPRTTRNPCSPTSDTRHTPPRHARPRPSPPHTARKHLQPSATHPSSDFRSSSALRLTPPQKKTAVPKYSRLYVCYFFRKIDSILFGRLYKDRDVIISAGVTNVALFNISPFSLVVTQSFNFGLVTINPDLEVVIHIINLT